MKKYLMSLVFIIVVAPLFAQSDTTKTVTSTDRIIYTCPMHPEVVSGEPGKCPKCGMDLVQTNPSSSELKMNMMMCPMHGMVGMEHKHDERSRDSKKMMKSMSIAMGVMMVVMIIIVGNR